MAESADGSVVWYAYPVRASSTRLWWCAGGRKADEEACVADAALTREERRGSLALHRGGNVGIAGKPAANGGNLYARGSALLADLRTIRTTTSTAGLTRFHAWESDAKSLLTALDLYDASSNDPAVRLRRYKVGLDAALRSMEAEHGIAPAKPARTPKPAQRKTKRPKTPTRRS